MSQSMISIEGLTKDYGTTHALQGLSFEVPRGQIVGFLGPNGAGKSTTMKILAGYATPTAGTARIDGMDVTVDSIATRRLLGYLPENNPLYEEMIVVDFLDFVAQVRGIPAAERQARMKNTAERCGLVSVIGKKIGELSKGFRQRVGLAQAILHNPDLLILDEPTSGLDPNQIAEIRNLIKELGAAKTVILCTHILSEVQTTCNRVLIINEGKLVADDTPEHLTTGQGGTVQVVLGSRFGGSLQPTEVRSLLERIPGVSSVEPGQGEGPGTLGFVLRYADEDPRRGLFEVAVKNNFLILEVRRKHVSLEETFRKLTAGEPQRKEPPAAAA
jgi:gliding motility-associated transport system ATP-binding protein